MLLTFIAIYVLIQIGIAAYVARNTKTDADYLVAGRKLGTMAVAMSLFATWFAAETVIATSAEVAKDGIAGARIEPFAYGIGILVLGIFVAGALRRGGNMTLADFMAKRFGRTAETLSAWSIATGGTMWASAQLYALATIIDSASGLNFVGALILSLSIVLVYTLIGGLMGDVVTDIIQGAILAVGIGILFFIMLGQIGGLGTAIANIPTEKLDFNPAGEPWYERLEIFMIPILGSLVTQEAISRTLGAKSPQIARRGAIIGSVIYMIVGLIPIGFGLMAFQTGLTLGEGDQFLPTLAEQLLPGWLYVIFAGALLSAILSSVDSALLAVSAVATENGIKRLRPSATPRDLLVVARISTFVAGVLALLIALSGESLRELVIASAVVVSVLVVPLLLGIYTKLGGARTAVTTIVVQGVMLVAFEFFLTVPGSFLITMVTGLVLFIALGLTEKRYTGDAGHEEASI
jgi:SSS family transporter